jgi:hypothetical protein
MPGLGQVVGGADTDDTTTNHSDTHWTPVPGKPCSPLITAGQVDAYVLQGNTF